MHLRKQRMNSSFAVFVTLLLIAISSQVVACRGETSDKPPIVPIRNMHSQPRYNAQATSAFFQDGRTMRPPVVGAIAREMEIDTRVSTGWDSLEKAWVLEIPREVVRTAGGMGSLVRRGKERYGIYCAPCHALSGNGGGMVSRRAGPGALAAPSLHTKRLRAIPDGQLYGTIQNGIRNMPAYKHSIPTNDRWAIVSYVRALQLSQAKPGEEDPTPGSTDSAEETSADGETTSPGGEKTDPSPDMNAESNAPKDSDGKDSDGESKKSVDAEDNTPGEAKAETDDSKEVDAAKADSEVAQQDADADAAGSKPKKKTRASRKKKSSKKKIKKP